MKQSKPKEEKPPEARRLGEVSELSVLERLSHGEPLVVELTMAGAPGEPAQAVTVRGRRLKPVETKEIKLLLNSVLPPILPPEKDGEPARYDFRDRNYLARLEDARREARALALWTAYPMFEEGWRAGMVAKWHQANPTAPPMPGDPIPPEATRKEIVEFIETRDLEDDLLEALFSKVTERTVASELVGFF